MKTFTKRALIVIFGCILLGIAYNLGKYTSDNSGQSTDSETISQWELFKSTNAERAKAGVKSLSYSPYLEGSAYAKCEDMVKNNYWAHNDKNGLKPWRFIDEQGVPYSKAAENLAYGFRTSQDVIDHWMASEEHRANLLDPQLKEVGFGICKSDNFISEGSQIIVVQHFVTEE